MTMVFELSDELSPLARKRKLTRVEGKGLIYQLLSPLAFHWQTFQEWEDTLKRLPDRVDLTLGRKQNWSFVWW